MYNPSRGILYADLPTADEEDDGTRTRAPADADEPVEEPSADDRAPASSSSSPVPEPADD